MHVTSLSTPDGELMATAHLLFRHVRVEFPIIFLASGYLAPAHAPSFSELYHIAGPVL
jgi:hypothetical protein